MLLGQWPEIFLQGYRTCWRSFGQWVPVSWTSSWPWWRWQVPHGHCSKQFKRFERWRRSWRLLRQNIGKDEWRWNECTYNEWKWMYHVKRDIHSFFLPSSFAQNSPVLGWFSLPGGECWLCLRSPQFEADNLEGFDFSWPSQWRHPRLAFQNSERVRDRRPWSGKLHGGCEGYEHSWYLLAWPYHLSPYWLSSWFFSPAKLCGNGHGFFDHNSQPSHSVCLFKRPTLQFATRQFPQPRVSPLANPLWSPCGHVLSASDDGGLIGSKHDTMDPRTELLCGIWGIWGFQKKNSAEKTMK